MEKEQLIDDNFEIRFQKDSILIRTVDNLGWPKNIWSFKKNELSKTEDIFINNMKSMAMSMISCQEEKE